MRKAGIRDKVGLILMSAASFMPLASLKASRLDRGSPFFLWDLPPEGLLIIGSLLALILLSGVAYARFGRDIGRYLSPRILWSLMPAALIAAVSAAGAGSTAPEGARLGLGAGFWLLCAASLILTGRDGVPNSALLAAGASLALCAYLGLMDDLSIYRELVSRRTVFLSEVANHMKLAVLSAFAATVPGVLLGYWCHVSPKARRWVMGFINLMQVIPTLSLLGLIMLPLSYLSRQLPVLADLGIRGIGFAPAFIALGLYCLLPVTANTLAGFSGVDRKALFSADAMGMTGRQKLIRIQAPLAFPVIFSGIRTALSQNIGNATIAGLVGGGGMGTLIFLGLSQAAPDLVLLGALPVILMALLLDGFLGYLEKRVRMAVLHTDD
ncbi:MAG TPA: ABC transporter permease [Bacillota bacterium]|nr:ABC transporter permease [Bacillota bacterium]HOA15518.1 ABC transporter permease [Bacillota bacterium]